MNILILVSIFSLIYLYLFGKKHEDQSFFSVGGIVKLLWEFLKLSTESLLIGVILGFTLSLLMKMMKVQTENSVVEIALIFVFAYVSYLIPEGLNSSGIMSLFAFVVVLQNYGLSSMTPLTRNVGTNIGF